MIFEGLAEKLQNTLKNLTGKGVLSQEDVKKAMREVKLALLDADVNYKVVKEFVNKVKERAVGEEVIKSLSPGQTVINIVNEELKDLMGTVESKINFSSKPPTVILMVGLQGAGKTTTVGKLAYHLKTKGKNPMLVACDVYRPAAIKQLEVVSKKAGAKFYCEEGNSNVVEIAKNAVENAKTLGFDTVIIDTAGRLEIDEILMNELKEVKKAVRPNEILLILDAMTGQDSVNIAEAFDKNLGVDGVILTKLDGDTRGGAALSIRAVTQKPIKFAAVGEKINDLEVFHPDRIANRILGMGDVLSLIEKAKENIDLENSKDLEDKIKKMDFNFEDFLSQMQQIKKMGPIKNLLEMIPGLSSKIKDIDIDDGELVKIEAIIQSMTKKERLNPDILNPSRKQRIAKGSGRDIAEVNRLIKQFKESRKMMKKLKNMKLGKGKLKMPFGF